MDPLLSLAYHATITGTAILIGWSTEVRHILRTRARLVRECAADGLDPSYAFELAGVDRVGVERLLIAAGCTAALVNAVAFFPGQVVAGELRDVFGWSLDTKTRVGSLVGLAATVVWSGLKVRRDSPASATI